MILLCLIDIVSYNVQVTTLLKPVPSEGRKSYQPSVKYVPSFGRNSMRQSIKDASMEPTNKKKKSQFSNKKLN